MRIYKSRCNTASVAAEAEAESAALCGNLWHVNFNALQVATAKKLTVVVVLLVGCWLLLLVLIARVVFPTKRVGSSAVAVAIAVVIVT